MNLVIMSLVGEVSSNCNVGMGKGKEAGGRSFSGFFILSV